MSYSRTLLNGALKRCPNCGERHITTNWWTLRDRCPNCGLFFEREEGYWTGAIAINLLITEFFFVLLVAGVVIATWPDIPMFKLLAAAIAVNVIVPLIFYPIGKTFWMALDLVLHPLEPVESHEVERLQEERRQYQTLVK
ncbi:MAG TPA: DUF983 domain-containing protein [Thermomicrobiaceae bacterium]|nr:DUF983 domain-containing protein [Thermomicrobiaceae bacterium]